MRQDDIAVIGIGCRYPGGADSPSAFWDMLVAGVDATSDVPPDRWPVAAHHDPRPGIPGKTVARRGGFIRGLDEFDAEFFGLSPREAELMDPQQRLLLEVAWEALEDGGVLLAREAADTGVFVGISTNDYSLLQANLEETRQIDVYTTTGNVMSIAANRISHALDLRGPSMAIDTACSSSLIAVHLACRALRAGDCKMALAGGVNALLLPTPFIAFSRMSMLSPDGHCKAFDASADGFVRAEGIGVVALEPLPAALARGRAIYAVIRGTAANQDGHTNGLTVPSATAQEAVVRAACRDSGIDESAISYVEAHGTGTPVGDPIEANALGRSIGAARPAGQPLLIGSVKTNIGHLEAGAGVAGLIKTALALRHRQVPPSLHFKQPSPHIDFGALNLRVVTQTTPLDGPGVVAGVNSFGFGGSNAHAILMSPPEPTRPVEARRTDAVLLTFAAPSRERSAAVARSWRDYLATDGAGLDLADVCYSAATRRNHRDERIAVAASDREELLARLSALAEAETVPGVSVGRAEAEAIRPVFVYSGQGTQWPGMGSRLMASEPVFRDMIERCDALFRELGRWSLVEELARDQASSRLNMTAIAQPAIFAIEAGLTALWRSWGIEPAAVVGHSVGEVAAAWAGGILTLEDAARVIFHRGRAMERAPERGRMLAVGVGEGEARRLIGSHGDSISLAAVNSPELTTLSGAGEALAVIAAKLEAEDVFHRFLNVEYAFHSAQMEPIREDLLDALGEVSLHKPGILVLSTVSGLEAEASDYNADYWWRNVRQPVLFGPAIGRLTAAGFTTFLEVGPHAALSGPVAECLRHAGRKGMVLGSLRRGEPELAALLASLGAMHTAGHLVAWDTVFGGHRQVVPLPRQVWQRKRYWRESEGAEAARLAPACHALLERALRTSEPCWETDLDLRVRSWLGDHRVQGHAVFPATGYVEMMLAAAGSGSDGGGVVLEDVDFRKAMAIAEGDRSVRVQLRYGRDTGAMSVASRDEAGEWAINAAGSVGFSAAGVQPSAVGIAALRARLPEEMLGSSLAEAFADNGILYGPAFRGVVTVRRRDGEALGDVRVPPAIAEEADGYLAHPAILDACLQVLFAALPRTAALSKGTFLPVQVDRIRLHHPVRGDVLSHVSIRVASGRTVIGDLRVLDKTGRVLIEIDGFRCQAVARPHSSASTSPEEWLHETVWRPRPRAGSPSAAADLAATASVVAAADAVARRHSDPDGAMGSHPGRSADLDVLATAFVIGGLRALGWPLRKGSRSKVGELVNRLRVASAHHRLFRRFLSFLVDDGVIAQEGDEITVVERPPAANAQALWRRMVREEPGLLPELTLMRRCGTRLPELLRGEVDPLTVLFPEGSSATLEHLYQAGWSLRSYNAMIAEAVAAAIGTVPAGRPLRVIEIGAGTGGLTAHVLPRLPANGTRYVFTDLSNAFFARAEQAFFDYKFVEFATLDIERPPEEQGFEAGSFDIVLASDVLHVARDLGESLDNVKRLLAPGGLLAAIEIPDSLRFPDLIFGMTAGWWRFADGFRSDHPGLRHADWVNALVGAGFDEVHALRTDDGPATGEGQAVLLARRPTEGPTIISPPAPHSSDPRTWLLFADRGGVSSDLARQLTDRGDRPILVRSGEAYRRVDERAFDIRPESPDDMDRLIGEIEAAGNRLVTAVHLWNLDAPTADTTTADTLLAMEAPGCVSLLHLVQTLSKEGRAPARLVVVTRGSQAIPGSPRPITVAAAPAWGLARVVANEERPLDCLLVDLDPHRPPREAADLLAEIEADEPDREVAFRDGGRHVGRVVRTSFDRLTKPAAPDDARVGYRLEIPNPGVLDRLALVEHRRQPPGPDEVEIAVCAAALNFRDVMKALGIYPTEDGNDELPGDECTGVVVSVGDGVAHLAPGDEVVAIGNGCLASHVTLPAALVFRKPPHLDFAEAVTIPVPFLTAWHALHEVGRLRRGETVLIHAATGGVGLAAIEVARAAGATVFATAGSLEKRELLAALGIEHVMDSRSLAFADEVREITRGRGVDVILNTLSGRAIERGIAALAPGGRFLEIGKRDIYQNARIGLRPFRNNVSFHAIDLRQVMDRQPQLAATEMTQVLSRVAAGRYHALPHRIFEMNRAVDAFRHLAQARHVGKVVVTTDGARVAAQPVADRRVIRLRPDATYMVTGGLGGFGLAVARWLVDCGARHLVLTGRRGAATEEATAALVALRAAGVNVIAEASDVTRREDVAATFDRIARELPPLHGILHAAMVIDDGLLSQLDRGRLARVLAPKVQGAWHLHEQSAGLDLDLFVLFSSFAALLGSAGQANYVAANNFLAALAHHRRGIGLPALTIDWGRIADAGYVDRNVEVAERLERMGLLGMPAGRATEALGRLIASDATHAALVRVDWQAWGRTNDGSHPARFAELAEGLAGAGASGRRELREVVLAAPEDERYELLVAMLRDEVAAVLRASAAEIDPDRPLGDLGLDSLMAIDLLNRIESAFAVSVPRRRLSADGTIAGLATAVLELVTGARPAAPATAGEAAPADCLVVMRSGGSGPPLVLLHPSGGLISPYAPLVEALTASLPVIGVQSRVHAAGLDEFDSLDEMAEAYAGLIAGGQPEGPLHLAGFSFGGILAVAVAAVLERRGREVALVCVLDADPGWTDASRPPIERISALARDLVAGFGRELRLIEGGGGAPLAADADRLLAELVGAREVEHVDRIIAWLTKLAPGGGKASFDHLRGSISLLVRHIRMLDGIELDRIRAPIVSLRARGLTDARAGWGSFTEGSLEEETLDCTHHGMLLPPAAAMVATRIERALFDLAETATDEAAE